MTPETYEILYTCFQIFTNLVIFDASVIYFLIACIHSILYIRWKNDPSSPSLIISFLPSGEWYASITRYRYRFGGGKEVVVKNTSYLLATGLLLLLWKLYWHGQYYKYPLKRPDSIPDDAIDYEAERLNELYCATDKESI